MEKIPKKKIIFSSIVISLIIVVITAVILPYSNVLSILGSSGTLAGLVVFELLGIEIARQELAKKYNICFGRFLFGCLSTRHKKEKKRR